MVTIQLPSFIQIKGRTAREAKSPKILYETIAVYDLTSTEPMIHLVELPGKVIQEHLDHRSRYRPSSNSHIITSVLIATIGITVAFFGLWALLGVPLVVSLLFALFQGLPIGAPIGWLISNKFAPKPLWIMKRGWVEEVEDHDGAIMNYRELRINSTIHSRFSQVEYVIDVYKDESGEHERTVPQVYRATSAHEMMEGRDEREDYKSRQSAWKKLEMGLVVVMALASIGLFILFALATTEPDNVPPPPPPVTASVGG